MSKRHAKEATPQRIETLSFIGQAGVASESQLHQRQYREILPASAHEALQQMVRAKWLAVSTTDVRYPGRAERVYTLTRAGAKLLSQAERERVQIGLPTHGELKQQLMAQDARIHIEEQARNRGAAVIDWKSERELRGDANRAWATAQRKGIATSEGELPDAQAIIREADGSIHELDIECDGHYFGKMLKSKVDRFAAGHRPTVWVCEPNRVNRIQAATARYETIAVLTL